MIKQEFFAGGDRKIVLHIYKSFWQFTFKGISHQMHIFLKACKINSVPYFLYMRKCFFSVVRRIFTISYLIEAGRDFIFVFASQKDIYKLWKPMSAHSKSTVWFSGPSNSKSYSPRELSL
jgi:hypothetical protein